MTPPNPYRHPAWFGSVMSTGALALALATEGSTWDQEWVSHLAAGFLILASLLAVVLLPRYLRRFGDRRALALEISDPGPGAMLATLPAGLLILAAAWGRIGPSLVPTGAALWIDACLLAVGVVLAVALGLTWSAAMLRNSTGLEGVNGGWLIPPVMNMLVPLGLAPLIVANPDAAELLLLVGYAFLGVGTLLFIAIFSLLVARLAISAPLAPGMAPTLWLPLAPAGLLGLSLIQLSSAGTQAGVEGFTGTGPAVVIAAMGLGFGLWWSAFAGMELRRTRKGGSIPVQPGWWGFVFPVGAMTVSLATVGVATDVVAVQVLGLLATITLAVLWAFVAVRTVRLGVKGTGTPRPARG